MLLAAWGSTNVTDGDSGSHASQPSTPVENQGNDEPIELIIYSSTGNSQEGFDNQYENAIREQFPEYTLRYIRRDGGDTLRNLITAGEKIDLIYDSIGYFPESVLESGMKRDMTDLIEKHGIDLSRFEPTLIDSMRNVADGEIYGLPVKNNNMVLYYNKDIFDMFGIDYPVDGMFWSEAIDLGNRITREENGTIYLGLAVSQSHIMRTNPFSLPYIDPETGKATINDEKWKRLFETIYIAPTQHDAYKKYIQENNNKVPFDGEFLQKKNLAMFGFLSGAASEKWNEMNWDMVALPTFEEAPGIGSQSYPTYFSVTSVSSQPDAAMQVIKFLTSDEFQMKISKQGIMPVVTDEKIIKAFGEESPLNIDNFGAVFYNKFAPIPNKTVLDSKVEKIFRQDITDLIMGNTDVNTALMKAEQEANQALEAEQ